MSDTASQGGACEGPFVSPADSGVGGPPTGPAGGDLGGMYPNPTVNDGADGTAIHDNIANEISAITVKAAPDGADVFVIEDSAAGFVKKKVTLTSILLGGPPTGPAGGELSGTYPNPTVNDGADATAVHVNLANEISGVAAKVTPIAADIFIIEDSAAGFVKKKVSVSDLLALGASPTGAAGGELSGTYPNPSVIDGADGSAIHDNIANEISAIADKPTPVAADIFIIEDSAAGFVKKKVSLTNLLAVGAPPTGAAGGELSGTYPNPTVNDGADGSAIHDNIAAEISAIAAKVTPAAADVFVIEDSAAAFAKKKVSVSDLLALGAAPIGPAGGELSGTYPNPTVNDGADATAIHDNQANEISAVAAKVVPTGADIFIIEDSAAAFIKKKLTVGDLLALGATPTGAAGGELSGTYPNPTVNDGADNTAIHDNEANEISALTGKVTPVSADIFIIEDSATGFTKKKVSVANLLALGAPPTGAAGGELSGTYPNPTVNDGADATAIHDNESGEINAVTTKVTPAGGDVFIIEDSASGFVKKKITVTSLLGLGAVPIGAAGGELSGTYPNPTVNDGADATAIHDNQSGEINAIAAKTTPASGDIFLLEDSAASFAKKKVTLGNILTSVQPSFVNGLAFSYVSATQVSIGVGSCRNIAANHTFTVTSTLTANITSSGANGLDTGSEASNTWYSVWVIGDSTGTNPVASLLSTSSTVAGLTFPAGYDRARRIGWVRNDGSSNFFKFTEVLTTRELRERYYDEQERASVQVLSSGSSTSYSAVGCSAHMPPTCTWGYFLSRHDGQPDGSRAQYRPTGTTVSDPVFFHQSEGFAVLSPAVQTSMSISMRTNTSQSLDYKNSNASQDTDLYVLGYYDILEQ